MQSLQRSILCRVGSPLLRWWPGVCRVCSAPLRWCPQALARREATLMAQASAHTNQHLDRLSCIGITSGRKQGKPDWGLRFSCATTEGMDKAETRRATKEVENDIWCPIIPDCSHRDGTIYRKRYWEENSVDIADRSETRLEPMRLSVSMECKNDPEKCGYHLSCEMLQILSLKLAKTPINSGSIQLYGYIAARDEIDAMLNYVFKRSRDDPIIVQQGALIEMTGPKRGIALYSKVFIEYDMRIKNGEQEDDDLQLIDGVAEFDGLHMPGVPIEGRINGNCGAVDMSLTQVENAVEATVEVVISEVQNGFDLSLSSIISVMEAPEEFALFHGTIGESCGLRRFVIAVEMDTVMHLKFKVGQEGSNSNVGHHCSFKAKLHGYACHQIKLELASISVKVTWATLFV